MTGILASILSFSLFILTHWMICRYLQWRPLSPVLNKTWLCFLPLYLIIFFIFSKKINLLNTNIMTVEGVACLFNGLILNVLFLMGYTVFFFLIERGLSLRVMIEIGRSPRGALSIEEIKKIYTYDYILEKRLGQMFKMNYALIKEDNIFSTKRAERLVQVNKIVRKIFNIKQVTT